MNCCRTILFCWIIGVSMASPAFADVLNLAWDANPEPSIAGYRVSYGTSSGNLPNTVDVGNQTSARISGLMGGQRYYFVVRAYNTWGITSAPSGEVSGVAVGIVALTSTAASGRLVVGAPVTWTVLSDTPSLEYQFWRLNQSTGAWSIVQSYRPQAGYTWTPEPGSVGSYLIQVWTRTAGSSEPFEAWRSTGSFTVANAPITIGSIEASVALPAATGTPMTWKARAAGGPAPLQYRFYRYNIQKAAWTLARDYAASDSFTWTPSAGDIGSHYIQVWVRGAGSGGAFDAWRSSEVFGVSDGKPAVATLTTSTSFPAGTGTLITWKAIASGGPGPLQYRFLRLSSATGTWSVVQDYGPSDSYSWTPSSAEQGSYTLQVWVRRSGSTAAFEAWTGTAFQIANATPVVRRIVTDAGAPLGTGYPTTFSAEATGGPGPLQYRFMLYNLAQDSWATVQNYSISSRWTWTPGSLDAGTYQLQVWVRRAGSTAALEGWASTGLFDVSNSAPAILAIQSNVGSSAKVGMPIVWNAKPAGGQGQLEYQFSRFNIATQSWRVVQPYSWDNSYAWVPNPAEQGTYYLQVWVRRSGSTVSLEGWRSTEFFTITN